MQLGARAVSKLVLVSVVLIAGAASVVAPRTAQALPSDCSTSGNSCTAPLISAWSYTTDPKFSLPPRGPFETESEAVQDLVNLPMGANWCSSSLTNVTYDDNWAPYGPSPQYSGNVDIYHGNTVHIMVTTRSVSTGPCDQTWAWDPGLFARRTLGCMAGWWLIWDNSVSPAVPVCLTSTDTWQPAKAPCPCTDAQIQKGDGLDATNANKRQTEVDYRGSGTNDLQFVRTYNSAVARYSISNLLDTVGTGGWAATYFQRLVTSSVSVSGTLLTTMYAFRPGGQVLNFNLVSGQWVRVGNDITDTLTSTGGGYEYRSGNLTETYDSNGRLLSIKEPGKTDKTLSYTGTSKVPDSVSTPFGQTLTFGYTPMGNLKRLDTVTDPAGQQITYSYESDARIKSVTYPDSTTRQYGIPASAVWALQTVTDEAGVAYVTTTYDGFYGPTETQNVGGLNHYSVWYDIGNSHARVLHPNGTNIDYWYWIRGGVRRIVWTSAACGGCQERHWSEQDANGNSTFRVDFNNNRTNYIYDTSRNLETSRTEALDSNGNTTGRTRTISTTWHSTWRKPTLITEPNRTTAYTYDSNGNVLTQTITDTSVTPNVSRVWTWTYDSYNRKLTEDGPRTDVSDVTTYTYYGPSATCTATVSGATTTGCRGQLNTVTNALSQVTTFNEYNGHGQPAKITDANGVVATLTYDARQRITSRNVGGETTTMSYWPTGLLKKVTLPDSSYVQYTYDNAHRLNKIEDGAGNRIEYTLDSMGSRTAENAYDPSSALARTHTRVFNSLNQLWKDVNAAGTAAGNDGLRLRLAGQYDVRRGTALAQYDQRVRRV